MHREKRSGSLSTLELRRDKFVELRSGSLGVRLAETESEKDAARALRYRVFYEEMGAIPNENIRNLKRDFDEYDEFSDYLLVIDYNKISDHERVVGTYRLIRKENADKAGGFYSRAEYDLSVLQEYPGNLLEVGRSCVHPLDHFRCRLELPPLIKGYLRLGGYVGDGAVIDQQFNTTDVAIILKTELIADKYYRHYERRLRDALEF